VNKGWVGPFADGDVQEKRKSFNPAGIETSRLSNAQTSHYRLDTTDSQITREAMYV
jgi:hypothetical protein